MSNGASGNITDHGDKLQLLNDLSSLINSTVYLKAWCDQKPDQANSNNYAVRLNRLNAEYTNLSDAIWNAWIGDGAKIKQDLQTATDSVSQNVKDIQRNVNTAQNIVKGIGYLDQAIAITAKLLA